MADLIHGKVAKVLNSRELALNVGSNQGVRVGMFFDVLDPELEEIRDPETNDLLGTVHRSKVRVKVSMVQEKLSVATTYKKWRVNVGGTGLLGGAAVQALRPPKWETRYETLKTSEATWEALDEGRSFVKTGDSVVEVDSFLCEEDD